MYVTKKIKTFLSIFLVLFILFYFSYYIFLLNKSIEKFEKNDFFFKNFLFLKENTSKKILEENISKSYLEKTKIIKDIQKKLEKIFDQNYDSTQIEEFELKKHNFKIGETVYSFILDTNLNIKPFQEGIISKDIAQNQNDYLPISIRGKNNKIFFNNEGEFIGISVPNQITKTETNYIITSNAILSFLEENFQIIDNSNTKYFSKFFLPIKFNKENKTKIFFDEKGLFLGFPEQTEDTQNYIFHIKNYIQQNLENNKKEIKKSSQKNKENEKKIETFRQEIKNLDKITFSVILDNYLGSCFIYKAFEKEEKNKKIYEYHILTNRHVVEKAKNNPVNIKLYNSYFRDFFQDYYSSSENKRICEVELLGLVDNERLYDDVGILKFKTDNQFKNPERFKEIQKILEQTFPSKEVKFNNGDKIYSMGSQLSQVPLTDLTFENEINEQNSKLEHPEIYIDLETMEIKLKYPEGIPYSKLTTNIPEINLLKKGDIIYFHDKQINFNIKLDNGNSGGPCFNDKGQIIGINVSSIDSNYITDQYSQCINFEYVKQIYEKIINLKKQNKNERRNSFSEIKEPQDTQKEIQNFLNFDYNLSEEKSKKIDIYIEDLFNLCQKIKIKKIQSSLLDSDSEKIKFHINLINDFNNQIQILSFDPHKEKIEISLKKTKSKFVIIFNQQTNEKTEPKVIEFDIKNIKNNSSFLSFELINLNHLQINSLEEQQKENEFQNKEKIKNSLIVWTQKKQSEGNGVILAYSQLPDKRYLYFVLSTYVNNNNSILLNKIKNFFFNKIEMKISNLENEITEEKGNIQNIYYDKKSKQNLAFITFISEQKYPYTDIKKTELLNEGEEIYFLINLYNQNYFPQMFQSNIGYKDKETFLFDSVFDLKSKEKIKEHQMNFLCFDKKGSFIGINHYLDKKSQIPSHFMQASLLKIQEKYTDFLFLKEIKNDFNQILSFVFLSIILFILIAILPVKKNYFKKYLIN